MVKSLFFMLGFAAGVGAVILLNWVGDLFIEKYFGEDK